VQTGACLALQPKEMHMSEKKASARWIGSGKNGRGQVSTETGALKDNLYTAAMRFEDAGGGTNPEEILGAAHAACFTMAFAFACERAGFEVTQADTEAAVRIIKEPDGWRINRIALSLTAKVPGLEEAKFREIAEGAKKGCPLSKALAAVPEITLEATLQG
jgi:lipoyl-dependent peroxiredoxin